MTEKTTESFRQLPERVLAGLDRLAATTGETISEAHWAFREAAAVLTSYDPATLQPVGAGFGEELAISWLLPDSERVLDAQGNPSWALIEPVRRRTLRRLESRDAMKRALAANPERPDDATQKAFEALVRNESVDLDALSQDQLAGLLTAVEWLEGILPGLPSADLLRRRAGLHRLLDPLRRLAGESFRNREDALGRLRDYVGVLPTDRKLLRFARRLRYSLFEWPPLFLWGPGGVGKSTVIARFVLDHAAAKEESRFPFVYLDFDRAGLVAEEPLTLLREAARQIGIEYPKAKDRAERLASLVSDVIASKGELVSESPRVDSGDPLSAFRELIEQAEPRGRPVLFVVDTFEEVQFLGPDRVEIVRDFLNALQESLPQLCVVVVGRARPDGFSADEIALEDLDPESARDMVKALLEEAEAVPLSDSELEELIDSVGTNPLSLKLAAGLVAKDRMPGLQEIETRRFGFLRAKAAQVQGMLYGRILDHIHDEDVRKLAYPGLVLRRITPEIIEQVLAGPCGVDVDGAERAHELFLQLGKEASLVEPGDDGSLLHRSDVRRLMLKDLERQYASQAEEIHRRAIDYYRSQPPGDLRARAEEIYHRLRLGQGESEIEPRWLPGVGRLLGSALEELAPAPRRYLSTRLGVTPDRQLLEQADLEEWEEHAVRSARRLLDANDPAAALALLKERTDRSDGSKLWAIEAEAWRLVGKRRKAVEVAERGIEAASRAGDLAGAAEMLMILSLVQEAEGQLDEALRFASEAADTAAAAHVPSLELRAQIARLRLLRKKGEEPQASAVDLRRQALAAVDRLGGARYLRRHGTVLRELAAELGAERQDELKLALRHVGLETSKSQLRDVAKILQTWDHEERGDYVAMAAGIDPTARRDSAWRSWVEEQGLHLGKSVASLLEKIETSNVVNEAITEQLRRSVDASIQKVVA